MSRFLTTCAAIGLWLSVAGLEKVDAKGGPFSLHGPWASASAQNNATDAGAPTGYETKPCFTPPDGEHQRSHRL
ncbi:hypothetical protein SAMN05444170_1430 [Bradyrhizobium erythrophlei]|uniref:Uncharacterized protein n=1 Tax=Bradyrhizobium erythrophlei TaxID=1437360 RepID=A0A1M7TDJ6_9BRAD|nr:hypothetical protein SAMN05444170_1430 [Bradyrhizobium erythrophlei]